MSDTLKESLGKAFDAAMEAETPPAPVESAPEPSKAPVMSEAPVPGAVRDTTPTMESQGSGKQRDEKGKFVASSPKPGGKQSPESAPPADAAPAGVPDPVIKSETTPAGGDLKAPANWKPAAREKWASLPPEVQAEAIRVHNEVSKTLNETAEARKAYAEIKEAIAPYEAMMRTSGYTPTKALQEYGQLNYTVYQGTSQQLAGVMASMLAAKQDPDRAAQAVAHAINMLNLNVDKISDYLGPAPQGAQQQAPQVDVNALVNQALEARIRAAADQKRQTEEQAFAASHEFYQDVAPRMRAIRAADPALSMDDVYRIACQMDPEISKVLQQRDAAKAAQNAASAANRAKAATGPRPAPAVSVGDTKPRSLHDSVAAAFDAHSGRT